ncbi:MAG: HAD family hydrolase [Deltaproteobacteria bacterium]|jgi:HAD superfamily hydrolase (TIGR01509 family)|nr:HAD family hydrolase [Deltaproteobacteria bacterium]
MLTTLIFDLDMTLLDSLSPCTRGLNRMARHFGMPETTEEIVLKHISLTTEAFWKAVYGKLEPGWFPYFLKEILPQVNAETKCYPEAIPLLDYCKSRQLLLGVATNRDNPWLDIAAFGIAHYFDTVVGAYPGIRPKPDPDIVQEVLKHLGVPASCAIFTGDSRSDMKAAKAAGVRGIGLTQGGITPEELSQNGASWVMGNLNEVREFLERDLV